MAQVNVCFGVQPLVFLKLPALTFANPNFLNLPWRKLRLSVCELRVPGFESGLVSVFLNYWGKYLSVHMVLARHTNHGFT